MAAATHRERVLADEAVERACDFAVFRESPFLDPVLAVVEQALAAQAEGADYLGVGAMFPTGTKSDATETSFETLREICRLADIPVVAIGGITLSNLDRLAGTGISGVAVVSAVFAQEDILQASRELKEKLSEIL